MSDAIEEITGKKKSSESAMAAWAASIAQRQQNQQNKAPEPESQGGGASPRTNASQRPKKIKTVTKNQKSHETVQKDQVDLARTAEKSQDELTMKDAQALMKGRKTQAPAKAPAPASLQTKAPVETAKQVAEKAVQEEVAKEAEVVTAEEVQSAPSVATNVASKSAKKTSKAAKTEETSSSNEVIEAEDDKELAELVKPGNGQRASAYVRASELLSDTDHDPDLDDFLVAL